MSPAPPADTVKVVALVTAYNEAATIGAVIAALRASPSIARVQVVDDGSTDATADIARAAGASVIAVKTRVPVGEAIMRHLPGVEENAVIMWCDADLVGLEPAHIEALIARYRRGDVEQAISSRALPPSWPGWLQGKGIQNIWKRAFGPLSGERVMSRAFFQTSIDLAHRLGWSEMMRGYGVVLFLNWRAQSVGRGSAVVYCEGLRQRQKYQKWGKRAGLEMILQWIEFGRVWMKIRISAERIRATERAS